MSMFRHQAWMPLAAAAGILLGLAACGSSGGDEPDADAEEDEATDVSGEADDARPDADVRPETLPDAEDAAEDPGADGDADVPTDVPEAGMNFYFGNFHSHTANWEGEGTPAENFAWARDVAHFDFYAVTDHSELLGDDAWNDTGVQADVATVDGSFVALRGFEWSHTLIGHSCVFNTFERTSSIATILLDSFYAWVDGNSGLAQFNHPGREVNNFDNLSYARPVAEEFFAIEVANKGDSIADGTYLGFYNLALDNGWYVAPTANQDNHAMSANSHRSAFVAAALTRDELRNAMRSRRIYATDDPNLRLTFRVGDAWMGSRLPAVGGSVVFTIRVEDDEPLARLDLIGSGGAVIFTMTPPADATEVTWEPTVWPSAGQWYYAKVTESDVLDGEPPSQLAVSAPIWFD